MFEDVTAVPRDKAHPQVLSLNALQNSSNRFQVGQKSHKPSQKKLLSLEQQRISSILRNCVINTEIAATIPAAVSHLDFVSAAVSKELARALGVHRVLGERLEKLQGDEQREAGAREGETEGAECTGTSLLEPHFKNSVRDLLRLFNVHPHKVSGLRAALGGEVGESEEELIQGLTKFHGHILEELESVSDEELQCFKKTASSFADEKELLVQLEEVAAAVGQREAEICKKHDEIKLLESCLQESKTGEARWKPLAEKQCQAHIKTSKMKHGGIQRDIDLLNIRLHDLMVEHRDRERALQEKNENLEMEIEYILHHFDDEIEEIQADLEISEMDTEREERAIRDLEKPYGVLEEECDRVWEKRRLAEEKREEEMKDTELKTKAAILAQAWWRGYCTRKALKNKAKNKKTKRGKSK